MTITTTPVDEETMFGDVIKLLHGDRLLESDRIVYDAAVAIRDEWPELDAYERRVVETMLAWAVMRTGNLRGIQQHAHARTQSPFSLRQNVTVGTDGTAAGMCRAIDARLTEYRVARTASFDGSAHQRCTALLERLKVEHPRLGLSFGYIGNCGFGPGGHDDRSWRFFTTLATPACVGACDVSFGDTRTACLGKLMLKAEAELPAWCAEQERRLDAREIRIVGRNG